MMLKLASLALISYLVAALPSQANEPTTLKFAFTAPPTTWVNTMGADPWSKAVVADAGGALDIKFFYGTQLGNAANIYDRTVNGVVEMSFGPFGDITDLFQKTNVVALPFETKNCTEAAIALWQLYKKGVIADEYGKVHPLAIFTFPDFVLTTKKQIRNLGDLEGVKIAASSRIVAQGVQLLGGVPVTLKPSDVYASVQRDLVNGMVLSWAGISVFKVDELTKYDLDMPLGVGAGYFFMNKDAYVKLPERARAALDKHSGDALNVRLAPACAEAGNANKPNLVARGHVLAELAPDEAERWKARVLPIIDEWVKATPSGGEVLAAYRREVAAASKRGSR
jgi:TRAP-type C4-dicarboxylate transport system substrate-binding protein